MKVLPSLLRLSFSLSLVLTKENFKPSNENWVSEPYKYLSYDEMREKMYVLRDSYPNLIRIETSEEKFNIPHYVYCGDEV